MSNNPFLKSKESNNRFESLHDDYKESSNKNNKKSITYEPSANSFTQPSRPHRDIDRNRDRNRDRDNNYRNRDNNYRNNNNFIRSKPRDPSPPPPIVDIELNNTELFPDLTINNNNNTTNTLKSATNFKQILTNVVEVQKPKKNPITPGWVSITMINGNIVYENGPLTPFLIKQQKQEELQIERENDLNYSMNMAINSMRKNWDRYENEYNEIHGEGAYEERFRLSPVYGPEYDTESEEESVEEESDEL